MSDIICENINDPAELAMKYQDLQYELDLLEKEFKILKESLFVEKFQMLNAKINEMKNEVAPELIELTKKLDAIKHNKITSQKFRRRFRINSVWNEYLSEIYSFERSSKIEKSRCRERLREDIYKNIIQIDKQIAKLKTKTMELPTGALAGSPVDDLRPQVSKRLTLIDKLNQRKIAPISPDSPYIVYNLDDDKIEQDLSIIQNIDDRFLTQSEIPMH